VHGTFSTASKALPRIANMGFDVVYCRRFSSDRQGPSQGPHNTVTAAPGDVGSPWAIGSDEGGHDAAAPRAMAPSRISTNSSPPQWISAWRWHSTWRCSAAGITRGPKIIANGLPNCPYGTIAYAENPPKKYQDIYPTELRQRPRGSL